MTPTLSCRSLDVGYDGRAVLRGINLDLDAGEIVALLGPNGAGKTTLLLTIAGFLSPIAGEVLYDNVRLAHRSPDRRARHGLVLVPDQRALFGSLTVKENLQLATRRGRGEIDDIVDLFPQMAGLLKRRADVLSGGEQQMLAIGRAMIQRPKVLMLDEMTLGLAPLISENIASGVRHAATSTGMSVLLVEQHSALALRTADRAVVIVHGAVRLEAAAEDLRRTPERLHAAYFGSRPQDSHTSARN
jgi:branched-chain amino acid transport system ATP-binding protein